MTPDLVERLRKQSRQVAELYGDDEPPDDDMSAAGQLWFTCQDAADEIERSTVERIALRAIVADLADCDPKLYDICALCEGADLTGENQGIGWHEPSCPWRRARGAIKETR